MKNHRLVTTNVDAVLMLIRLGASRGHCYSIITVPTSQRAQLERQKDGAASAFAID